MIDFPTDPYDIVLWCYHAALAVCGGIGFGVCVMAPIAAVSLSIEFAWKRNRRKRYGG